MVLLTCRNRCAAGDTGNGRGRGAWESNKKKKKEEEREESNRWRDESVDYGLWPRLSVCVSQKCFHTVRSNSQGSSVCDCVCISSKVSSNWESAALMLTGGLHAKIAHTYAHTPAEAQSVSPQCFFPPPLMSTLISGERQKVRQSKREQDWERFVKDKHPVWCQSSLPLTLLVFVNHKIQKRTKRSWGEMMKQMEGAGNGMERQSTMSHSVSLRLVWLSL